MKILGVDPSTNFIGMALFTIDDKTLDIINIEPFTYSLDKPAVSHMPNYVVDRLLRLDKEFYEYVRNNNIDWLAIEAGFINRLRPAAFGPLSKSIHTLESAFIRATNTRNITEYAPTLVKSYLKTESGTKEDMLKAVAGNKELNKYILGQSEHAIDAIAIGYSRILDIRSYPESILLKIK